MLELVGIVNILIFGEGVAAAAAVAAGVDGSEDRRGILTINGSSR